jgi:transcriptional regulator with XRE-family HTH domain
LPYLSREESSEKAGIQRTYVSPIELAKVSLVIEVANQLVEALGKRQGELVRDANDCCDAKPN